MYTGDPSQDVPAGCKGTEICQQCFYGAFGRLLWPNVMYLSTDGFQRDGNTDFLNVPVNVPLNVLGFCAYQWYYFSNWIDPGTGLVNDLAFTMIVDDGLGNGPILGGSFTVNGFRVTFNESGAIVAPSSIRPFRAEWRFTGDWYSGLPVFDRGVTIIISEDPL